MAKPKLALIPASQGPLVYSVLPSDGSGDFSFSRGSSATRINSQGLIETVASGDSRLEYPLIDGKVVGCPHHILEPARTNLISYSEDFSNAAWAKQNVTITSNSVISPDGTLNADKLVEGTTTGEKFTQTIKSVSNTTIYTASVFVKFAGREWIRLTDAQSSNRIHFNTKTGVFGSATGTVISYESTLLGDGWYKLSLTTTSVATAYAMRIVLAENDNDVSYTGDGTSGVYIYGAQLEEGSYPTSYIKSNSGSATTRSAETAYGAGDASTFNDSEGVLMAEIGFQSQTATSVLEINDSTLNNRVSIYSESGTIKVNAYNGVNNFIQTPIMDITNFNKVIISYKLNDLKLYVNGFIIGTDNIFSGFTNSLNNLMFSLSNGALPFYGNVKQLQYFQTVLTDSEIEQLTSWISFTDMANGQQYTIE